MKTNGHNPGRARRLSPEVQALRTRVGQRLKKAREAKGLSQESVARYIRRSTRTYSRWERGRTWPTDLTDLIHAAVFVGADITDELLPGGDEAVMARLHDTVKEIARFEARQEARRLIDEEAERLERRRLMSEVLDLNWFRDPPKPLGD